MVVVQHQHPKCSFIVVIDILEYQKYKNMNTSTYDDACINKIAGWLSVFKY